MKKIQFFFFAITVIALTSCQQDINTCPSGTVAQQSIDPYSGRTVVTCVPVNTGCNTCGGNGGGGGGGTVTWNFRGSVYTSSILTSTAAQKAFAFDQETGQIVRDNSGNAVTSPQLYAISTNPWNGTSWNSGQALITNYGTSQGQGLYNRMCSAIQNTARGIALQNTMQYLQTGYWNPSDYYVMVTLRQNDDGSSVGKTGTGTLLYSEVTDFQIFTGSQYFY